MDDEVVDVALGAAELEYVELRVVKEDETEPEFVVFAGLEVDEPEFVTLAGLVADELEPSERDPVLLEVVEFEYIDLDFGELEVVEKLPKGLDVV